MSDPPETEQRTFSDEEQRKMRSGFEAGDVIATRYRVEKLLGKGGMGMVYRVLDLKTEEQIALKTLLPKFAVHKKAIARFVREVNTVRRLDHPGIVKIFDARQYGPMLYYTMEYIKGITLREYMMRRKRLGLGSTVRILTLLCNALEHAHEVTIHRDISPENIMLLPDATIRLLDFGLAKLEVPNDPALTRIGTSLGKMRYKAPEQQVNAAAVDMRADLYPLGVMFFEMLTGKHRKIDQSILEIVPKLPDESDEFLDKAMAFNPDERFSTATEFRLALMRIYQIYKGIDPDSESMNKERMQHNPQPTPEEQLQYVPSPNAYTPSFNQRVSLWKRLVRKIRNLFSR